MNLPEQGSTKRRKRIVAVALSIAVALGVATAVAVPLERAAVSTTASTASTASKPKPPKPVAMGSYPTSKYTADAATIPGGLVTALKRDLGLTPAQYLADSAAAVHAVTVVAALKSAGVHVLGSKMSGTKLTVNVASSADKAAVKAVGATAVVGAPKVTDYSKDVFKTVSASNIYGGEAYFYQEPDQVGTENGYRCSIGFNGYAVSNGAPQFATAGHCATTMETVHGAYPISLNKPTFAGGSGPVGSIPLGAMVPGEGQFGNWSDYGIVSANPTYWAPQPALYTWGDAMSAPLSSAALPIVGQTAGINGAALCKSGSTSGWTCGTVLAVDDPQYVEDDNSVVHQVNAIVASTCLLPGDSGGGAVIGEDAAGIDSASDNASGTCTSPKDDQGHSAVSDFFPMVSTGPNSVQGQQGANWQLAVAVSTPVVTTPASGSTTTSAQSLSGTLANASSTSTVSLYLDGSATATSTISASTGSWSFPLSAVATGTHTYSVVARSGYSASTAKTGSFTLVVPTPAAVSGGVGDFNSDGNADIIARDASGALWLYPGKGSAGTGTRIALGTAATWQSMTAVVPVGDFNGDGHADVIARDTSGTLWLYPGNGSNGFGARIQLATGWQSMTTIQGVGDFNGDGHRDILARNTSGVLSLYPGDGDHSLGAPVRLATGWQSMTAVIGVGDFNGDGKADILARDASGTLWLYPGNGSNALGSPIKVSSGWAAYSIVAAGDFNNDGTEDILARDSSGVLWLYGGTGSGTLRARVEVSGGWTSYKLAGDGTSLAVVIPPPPAYLSGGVGDFNGDGNADVVARDASGVLWLYPGNGKSGFGARVQLATGWQSMTAIVSVGDFNGDGYPDIVARDSAGVLWLYPGSETGALGARVQIGANWGSMTMIEGVTDLTGDGHVDILARDNTGTVWLYPGTGTGGLGTRVQLATGWGTDTAIVGVGDFDGDGDSDVLVRSSAGVLSMYPGNGSGSLGSAVVVGSGWGAYTIVAVGDFNHDGTEDVLARDAGGVLWLYPGNGAGKFLARVKVGSGWSAYTLAGSGNAIAQVVPPALSGGVGDFNGDGNADVVARDASGVLWLYPGNGKSGFGTRIQLATGWQTKTAIVAVGDLDGDGHPDVVAREADGSLSLYSGNGSNQLSAAKNIGSASVWGKMTMIQGVADLNGDGHVDLLARDASGTYLYPVTGAGVIGTPIDLPDFSSATAIVGVGDFDGDGDSDVLVRSSAGVLSMYPGNGSGSLGSAVVVGSGWGAYTIVAVGDFNHDGTEDVLARDAGGVLWLYPGNGAGKFLARVKVGSGWSAYTLAGSGSAFAAVPTAP